MLEKTVKRTAEFRWIKREFLTMSQNYRWVRRNMGNPMDSCFWCNHAFADGEMMALGAEKRHGNVVLCQGCAKEASDG